MVSVVMAVGAFYVEQWQIAGHRRAIGKEFREKDGVNRYNKRCVIYDTIIIIDKQAQVRN